AALDGRKQRRTFVDDPRLWPVLDVEPGAWVEAQMLADQLRIESALFGEVGLGRGAEDRPPALPQVPGPPALALAEFVLLELLPALALLARLPGLAFPLRIRRLGRSGEQLGPAIELADDRQKVPLRVEAFGAADQRDDVAAVVAAGARPAVVP